MERINASCEKGLSFNKHLSKRGTIRNHIQIRRSVVSIPSNIAEGAARSSDKELILTTHHSPLTSHLSQFTTHHSRFTIEQLFCILNAFQIPKQKNHIFGIKFIKMRINKKNMLNDLGCLLKSKFSDNLMDIVLFGSQVYGKVHEDSDYDILIILKQKADWKTEREISDICYEIDLKYNIITDTHIMSESELSTLRGKQPVFVNALSNGLHI